MNKEMILSIKPEHLYNILKGKKTLELRKSVPKDFVGWVNLYCTNGKPYLGLSKSNKKNYYAFYNIPALGGFDYNKGEGDLNGLVVARFWFDEFETVALDLIDKSGYDEDKEMHYESTNFKNEELQQKTRLSNEEIDNYLDDNGGYAWHIKNLEIFDTPKKLEDFGLKRAPQSWCYAK